MSSVTASGYVQENFTLGYGTPLLILSFILDATVILSNLVVFCLLQSGLLKNPFSGYLKVCHCIDIAYKLFSLAFMYLPCPPIVNWLYVVIGYLGFLCNALVQIEIFKRFVAMATAMSKSTLTVRHLTLLQWTLFTLYIICCLSNQIVLIFFLGNFQFATQAWFTIWYVDLAMLFIAIVAVSYLTTCFYQIHYMHVFMQNLVFFDATKADLERGLKGLLLSVILCTVDTIAGYSILVVGIMSSDTQISYLLINIANAMASLLPIFFLLTAIRVKVLLVKAIASSSKNTSTHIRLQE